MSVYVSMHPNNNVDKLLQNLIRSKQRVLLRGKKRRSYNKEQAASFSQTAKVK